MQPITFDYKEEDYIRAGKFIARNFYREVYLGLIVSMVALCLIYFWRWGTRTLNLAWLAPLVAVWLVTLVALPMIQHWWLKKQVKDAPSAQGLFTYTFSDDGLKAVGQLEQFECRWEAFVRATETEDDFYFYTAKTLARFLPKKAFASDLQQSQLRALLKTKLGDKAQLNS